MDFRLFALTPTFHCLEGGPRFRYFLPDCPGVPKWVRICIRDGFAGKALMYDNRWGAMSGRVTLGRRGRKAGFEAVQTKEDERCPAKRGKFLKRGKTSPEEILKKSPDGVGKFFPEGYYMTLMTFSRQELLEILGLDIATGEGDDGDDRGAGHQTPEWCGHSLSQVPDQDAMKT